MADTRQTPVGSPWVVPEPVWAAGSPQRGLADALPVADSSATIEQPTLAHNVLPPEPSRRAEWRYRMAMRRVDWRAGREQRAWERHNRPIPPSGPAAWFVGDTVTLARRFAPLGLLLVAGVVALAVAVSGNSSIPAKASTPSSTAHVASVTASPPRAAAHHRVARPAHQRRHNHAVRGRARHRAKPKAHTTPPVVSTPSAPVVAATPVYTPAYTPPPTPVVTPTPNPTPTPTPTPVATKPVATSSPPIAATKGTAPTSLPGRTATGG
jgi:hypothetical protein